MLKKFFVLLLKTFPLRFFCDYIKLRKRRLLRESMRGYRELKKQEKFSRISSIRIEIEKERFPYISKQLNKTIFFNQKINPEVAVKQYLLTRYVLDRNLDLKMLASVKSKNKFFTISLPTEWRGVLALNGMKIRKAQSEVAWRLRVFTSWGRSVVEIILFLLRSLTQVIRRTTILKNESAHFEGLSRNCLPQFGKDGQSFDVISWYLQWDNRNRNVKSIYHNVVGLSDADVNGVKVTSTAHLVPLAPNIRLILYLFVWSLHAASKAFFDLLCGRWWNVVLLGESFKALVIQKLPLDILAKDYLFQSNWTYRPLWTYEAEERGSRVLFYFYSTNSEGVKTKTGYKPVDFDWRSITWSHYLVWDAFQAAFIRQVIPLGQHIEVVGPIWLQNSHKDMPVVKPRSIAVFDVQPLRHSAYHVLGAPMEYYVPQNCIQFMKEIYLVARESGYQLVWKRKRKIGKLLHPAFMRFSCEFANLDGVVIVDEEISAVRVIKATELNISMPFTSTAILGKSMNKRGCYFDPSGVVFSDDRGAHGVDIVSGISELRRWVLTQEAIDCNQQSILPLEKRIGHDTLS